MSCIKHLVAALMFGAAAFTASAETIGGNASLSVTVATSNVALPASTATYPAVIIAPAPGTSQEVFYAFGKTSATAATLTSPSLPSGGMCFANVGSNAYVAAITASSTAMLRITQLTQCPQQYAGSGSATQGTLPWVDSVTTWGTATLGAATSWGVAPTGNVAGVNAYVISAPALAAGSAIVGKVGIDQTTPGATNLIAAGQTGTWQVTPQLTSVSTLTLTSSTTAYTSGQLIASSATAASIVNPSFSMPSAGGAIPRIRFYTTDTLSTAWAGASVQLDLWNAAPTWTNGDHGVWLPATGAASHIGSFSCLFPSAVWGDGIAAECVPTVGVYISTTATTIYWSVQATSGSGVLTASRALKLIAEVN